jgi:ribosomal subunit interface protein
MVPIQIVIRDMPDSEILEDHIRKKAEKLSRYFAKINSVRIAVEIPQNHKRNGKLFRVRIDLAVPGKALVVNHHLNQDVYIAIRDAFRALLRQLESYAKIRRGDIKRHESPNFGYISKVFPEEQYGFIEGVDGNEYYFNVTNAADFDRLFVGDMVQFLGADGSEGRQAHRVTLEKKTSYSEHSDQLSKRL